MTAVLEAPPSPPLPAAPPCDGDQPERTSRWIHVQDANDEERWLAIGRACVLVIQALKRPANSNRPKSYRTTLVWTDSDSRGNNWQTYYSLEHAQAEGLSWLASLEERLEDDLVDTDP